MSSKPSAPSSTGPVPVTPVVDIKADALAKRDNAEQKEVAGRHKNDGQLPHKGAR